MGARAAVLVVLTVLLLPVGVSAQGRLSMEATRALTVPAAPRAPVVAVAPVTLDNDDSIDSIQRASERVLERLRPIEQRLREDDRLRRAGTVVGLSAVALGAMHGTKPLTFAGTQALRFGLQKQLTAIQHRSGFTVEPSIGHRSVSVSLNRTFND
jgi:hypothetical protein